MQFFCSSFIFIKILHQSVIRITFMKCFNIRKLYTVQKLKNVTLLKVSELKFLSILILYVRQIRISFILRISNIFLKINLNFIMHL